jgi:hypothetical protein
MPFPQQQMFQPQPGVLAGVAPQQSLGQMRQPMPGMQGMQQAQMPGAGQIPNLLRPQQQPMVADFLRSGGMGPGQMPPHMGMVGAPPPGAPQPPRPSQPLGAPPPAMPPGGVEQGALGGGGVGNKQQISNFLQALQQAGAGGNNQQMGAPQAPQQQIQPLVQQVPQQMPQNPQLQGPNAGMMQPIPANAMQQPNPAMMQQQPRPMPGLSVQGGGMQMLPPNRLPQQSFNLSQGALMSDERQKEAVEDAKPSLMQFLGTIGAHQYEYRNPELDGAGTYVSPMAQELERTDLGKSAVLDTPRGKMVDYGRLGGINLAAVSVVHRELEKVKAQVEALRRSKRG